MSGAGGSGAVSFHREKFVPRGGPDGGNGGRGGDVCLRADPALATLLDLRYRRIRKAGHGRPGEGKNCTGANGTSIAIRVPVGTQVYDAETNDLLADLDMPHVEFVVAKGGRGGRGNAVFATPTRRSPDFCQPGEPGEEREVRLELKLLADVGLVGFPNAGKSTLVSRVSRARPKIADYPFTTLTPNLGVVKVADDRSYVMADIPGIIEGAAQGAGLGIRFLRHIERTRLFLFLITEDLDPARDPISDLRGLRRELAAHDPSLNERPYFVVLTQIDRPEVREWLPLIEEEFGPSIGNVLAISSVTGEGLRELLIAVARTLDAAGQWRGESWGRGDNNAE